MSNLEKFFIDIIKEKREGITDEIIAQKYDAIYLALNDTKLQELNSYDEPFDRPESLVNCDKKLSQLKQEFPISIQSRLIKLFWNKFFVQRKILGAEEQHMDTTNTTSFLLRIENTQLHPSEVYSTHCDWFSFSIMIKRKKQSKKTTT